MFKRLNKIEGHTVTVTIEGDEVQVPEGETAATAALVHSLGYTRTTSISGAPRSPLCMMGVCFECLMEIDGLPNRQACQVQVKDGMTIRRQQGVGGTNA